MLSVGVAVQESLRPIRRSEYDRLIELGFFAEDERVQLLEGMLYRMSPQGRDHALTIALLTRLFSASFGDRALVWAQLPLALSDDSEPEPDLALVSLAEAVRGKPRKAYLVVEVASSSLEIDRTLKARLYAKARVPEYWIVNLEERHVEVHRRPLRGRYAQVSRHAAGESLEVAELAGPTFRVDDILPAAGYRTTRR